MFFSKEPNKFATFYRKGGAKLWAALLEEARGRTSIGVIL